MVDVIIEGKWYKIPKGLWEQYEYVIEGDVPDQGRFTRENALKAIERVGTLKQTFDKIYNY